MRVDSAGERGFEPIGRLGALCRVGHELPLASSRTLPQTTLGHGRKASGHRPGRDHGGGANLDAYARAGADGIFVPGVHDQARIAAIVEASPLPVNVLAGPTLSQSELAAAGVARISTGSLLHRSALSAAVQSLSVFDDDRPAETAGVLSYRAVGDPSGGQSSS
ncbi:isocitrate lyase/phosphoenolpyruvate mutase family protein [Brevibacterium sp.]|uniref:isocitrate lyase/phosphoenolpyruvate mutase family protein n=1 Tax=Brevibacterium sp. TaxID=1701 RepID=UPI00344DFE2C